VLLFRCNILISGKIIKEMPGSVASGTPYIYVEQCYRTSKLLMSCCSHTCVCVYQMHYTSLTAQTLLLFMLVMIALICYSRDIMFYKSGHSIVHRISIVFFLWLEFVETLIAKLMHAFIPLTLRLPDYISLAIY